MKVFAALALLFAIGGKANAQKTSLTLFAGTSNYQGDLQDKRFTFDQSHPAIGLGILYEFSDRLYGRFNVTAGKISGDDKKNSRNVERNLSFTSGITDVQLGAEYHILSLYDHSIGPYIFAGVSFYHFNPKAVDSAGNKLALRPLSTEGQGFYNGRKQYSLNQFSIPFGGGFKMSLSERLNVGIELGLRKTFTDYLDDVSTTYVDQSLLLANRGQTAVDLAYRGDELKSGLAYPPGGTQRGSSKYKDWYYFTGITIGYQLGGNKAGGKDKTGCPAKVY